MLYISTFLHNSNIYIFIGFKIIIKHNLTQQKIPNKNAQQYLDFPNNFIHLFTDQYPILVSLILLSLLCGMIK